MFSNIALFYILFAFIFQLFSLGFVIIDSRCKSKKIVWIIAITLTGPVALSFYFFKGRE